MTYEDSSRYEDSSMEPEKKASVAMSLFSHLRPSSINARYPWLKPLLKKLKLILVRSILVSICGLLIGSAVCSSNGRAAFLFFIIPVFLVILETAYITIIHDGNDLSW